MQNLEKASHLIISPFMIIKNVFKSIKISGSSSSSSNMELNANHYKENLTPVIWSELPNILIRTQCQGNTNATGNSKHAQQSSEVLTVR